MTATLPTLPSQYEPTATEAKWQAAWEDHQVFQADPHRDGTPFCVVIPPPNVTGSLHMGHAFESALIDALVRYHRMQGDNTLWLPGTDHASIAVSTILEKQLQAEGKRRQEISREEYLERAWQWKESSGGTIVNQLKRLGVSVDWSRERFTMDEGLSQAVVEAFVQLYEAGLIYRGQYMVNWCPASQSAVSDLEVDNQEVNGHLWHFRYPLTDGSGAVEVATTRPETMLGDTAVAVNPTDERYKHLIGRMLTLPLMGREIPIIGDELVEPSFGTGCVKVTPAHDPNDFEMGQRHSLPMINILNKDGSLNENAGEFVGLDRFVARKQVVERLEAEGALVKIEDYKHTVPYSDRGKVPVEPLMSTQWFVKIDPLAEKALTFLDQQQSPNFVPERWTKVYRDWLANLRDWCISRQLWWGHQIPAWYAVSETGGEITDQTPFVVARTAAAAQEQAIAQYGPEVQLAQDPDVLDTWFSSGLWPFSTLGWPEQTTDLARYYPTSTLVTGFDIIFFWVARMTLMAAYFTDQMPFQDVYIHGLVRDENNKKMSKSANNGIDPLLLIDKYGTDALRYTLIREVAGAGQDIRLEYNRKTDESASVEASRNFANKLWNASRFVMLNLEGPTPAQLGQPQMRDLELADRWILSRYQQVVNQTCQDIDRYGLGEAAKGLYDFIWGDFCDWYIELVKPRLRQASGPSRRVAQQTLAYVLEGVLKLLHPFMPHITEEIWHTLTQAKADQFLALQPYPAVITQEAEVQPANAADSAQESISATPAVPVEEPVTPTVTLPTTNQVHAWVTAFGELPERTITWLNRNPQAIWTSGLVVAAFVLAVFALALLNTLEQIPLVAPTLELIGLGATGWFSYRHLLWKADRQQVGQQIQQWQRRVVGESPAVGTALVTTPSSQSVAVEPAAAIAPSLPEPKITTVESALGIVNPELETQFTLLIETIRTLRNLRQEADIKPGVQIEAILQTQNPAEQSILTAGQSYIQDLAKVETLQIVQTLIEEPQQSIVGVVGTIQVLIPLAGVVDVAALRAKVEKDLGRVAGEIKSLQGRLSNRGFVDKAPPEVVQGAQAALAEAEKQAEILRDRLRRL